MKRIRYIKDVTEFVEKLLSQRRCEMPTGFKIKSIRGAQSDWRLTIEIGPEEDTENWFDCEELFQDIVRIVNDKFASNKWYFGITIDVPLNYLGKLGSKTKLDRIHQEQDNLQYRSIRLKKGREHG